MTNLTLVHEYIHAVESGATGDALARFFAPTVTQTEYPNQMLPRIANRNLEAILEGALRGQQVVANQRFEILREYESGNTVILEVLWRASLRIPVAAMSAGDTLTAHIAIFIEISNGAIVAQRNYDCYLLP